MKVEDKGGLLEIQAEIESIAARLNAMQDTAKYADARMRIEQAAGSMQHAIKRIDEAFYIESGHVLQYSISENITLRK